MPSSSRPPSLGPRLRRAVRPAVSPRARETSSRARSWTKEELGPEPLGYERPVPGQTPGEGGAAQMAISRWDPFRDLMSIQNELNRLFGRTYGGESGGSSTGAWVPPLDIYETEDKYVITVELPGVEPESVDVSVEDQT